ncbi:MAG: SDR family NAD(P)-dependent oxidoreductase [Bacteroidetes bacterium]|nr:SDR family NAD(P)-dependent oxidoreductase [Bacteroidota bacterium]
MTRTILITGATSGIGKACAIRFAKLNDRIIICGRRIERLRQMADNIRSTYNAEVFILSFDIKQRKSVEEAINSLPLEWKSIDILVNNAGLAVGLDPMQGGNINDWEEMIDTNIKGLLYISRMISPMMIDAGKGHIVNIGSIAGKEVYPKGNVYCATKFAVNALTKGMRLDLLEYGIKVSQVCPGATETEFSEVRFKGDKQVASQVYKGYEPLTAEDIAEAVIWVTGLPAHVNVNDLVIMPTAQAAAGHFNKKL